MDDLEEMAERIILLSKGQIAFDGNFEELRKVQNNSSRLIITSTGEAPALDEMEFIGSEEGKHSYKFDKEKIKINDIFKKLSQYTEIVDIEIIKAPIEDIIADLYNSWKK
jgi:ABC-2 type transport system ATP-binding protein